MSRLFIALSFLVVYGCVVTGDDRYSNAAHSWLGADIEEMLAVWPAPNLGGDTYIQGQPGESAWKHRRFIAAFSTAPGGVFPGNEYHCEAIARYYAAGKITDVEVKVSRLCYRRFSDEEFSLMTRNSVTPKNDEVEWP